ncbi:MAG: SUMF1/EgtB/PvdO family nonheme iron enzyme [Lentimonas sp.]
MDQDVPQSEPLKLDAQDECVKDRILDPGESFGNFRVVKCLTSGLIVNYYLMQHVRDLSDVTVGIFHSRTVEDAKFFKRLQSLQKTLEGFEHESIPKMKDSGLINERHCIFLEPVRGQSLSQYFDTHGDPGEKGLEVATATWITAQLLGVLGYAHSKGLDHRDMDSELIFIQEDGALQILGVGIKLTLGVELFESIVSASVSPLISNQSVGRLNSFDVMSPEYKAGRSEDSRVDVYAVGMIGYWLLTAHKASITQYSEVNTYVKGLAEEWDAFFVSCLVKEPDARYQSCKLALLGLQDTEPEDVEEAGSFVQRQIDFILKPGNSIERGGSDRRVFRLCMIGILGLSLTALVTYYMRAVFFESEEPTWHVVQQAARTEVPDLVVSLNPQSATIQLVGYKEKFIANDGLVRLMFQPGSYNLSITAPHHNEERATITIPEETLESISLEVYLQPELADVKFISEANAMVSVTDEHGDVIDLGMTNDEGVLLSEKSIIAGTYQVLVQKEGYVPGALADQKITFGEVNELKVELVSLPSSLAIYTQPEGARILLNDELVGLTPLTLDPIDPSDGHLIVAHIDGYRSLGRRVEVEAGQQLELDFGEMVPLSGGLTFTVSFVGVSDDQVATLLEDLTVELDGEVLPYSDGVFEEIQAGPLQVHLSHPLYISATHTITISNAQNIQVNANLSPRPGVLELVLPKAMSPSLLVNGKAANLVDGQISIAAVETVELELRIKNYLTMTREVTLEPNEHFVWEVDPVAISGPEVGESWTVPYLGHVFVWVPASTFTMGSPPVESGRLPSEGPKTEVRFSQGFWAAIHEMTQSKFVEIMDRNPSEFVGLQRPVEGVTWADAKLFCQLLTQDEESAGRLPQGYVYRLPTEAEWEYMARAGMTTAFSFGGEADPKFGNFRGVYPISRNEATAAATHYGTLPVGSYQANAFGLYDMHGNVQEWTLDYYNGRHPGGRLVDPAPRIEGSRIAVRGGSWEDFATAVRSAVRKEVRPDTRASSLGFRVVLAPMK